MGCWTECTDVWKQPDTNNNLKRFQNNVKAWQVISTELSNLSGAVDTCITKIDNIITILDAALVMQGNNWDESIGKYSRDLATVKTDVESAIKTANSHVTSWNQAIDHQEYVVWTKDCTTKCDNNDSKKLK